MRVGRLLSRIAGTGRIARHRSAKRCSDVNEHYSRIVRIEFMLDCKSRSNAVRQIGDWHIARKRRMSTVTSED